jgi:hypothetical protein
VAVERARREAVRRQIAQNGLRHSTEIAAALGAPHGGVRAVLETFARKRYLALAYPSDGTGRATVVDGTRSARFTHLALPV